MRLGALVVRRFKAAGGIALTELVHPVELGIPPSAGMRLVFPDGAEIVVSSIRYRVPGHPGYGVQPVEVELIGCREPLAHLEAALAAGWQRVADPPGAPRPETPTR